MDALQKWRVNLPDSSNTLKAAAELLGVSVSAVRRYERGLRHIKPSRVTHISKVTGIPREVLRPDVFGPANHDTE